MFEKYILDGDDWTITGLWRNQTAFTRSYTEKLIDTSLPAVPSIPAIVPGAVNSDLMRAGLVPDYNIDTNSVLGEWVEHREWVYSKEFTFPEERKSVCNILCFEGLDYEGDILLNDKLVTSFKGTFRPVEIDVTGYLNYGRENTLQVLFKPTPEIDGMYGYSSKVRHLKSRFNYLWDWCPRIVCTGIWDHVYIDTYDRATLRDIYPKAGYADGKGSLKVTGVLQCTIPGLYTLMVQIYNRSTYKEVYTSKVVMDVFSETTSIDQQIEVDGILPWWPNVSGDPNLYDVIVSIQNVRNEILCRDVKSIGFRSCRFINNKMSAAHTPPYTVEINGKPVFLQGVNWVPVQPFYGCVTKEDYMLYLGRFRDMNCNLVRVWGGAIIEKKEFYEVCDQYGLLVWQELLQSSSAIENTPPSDPEFLDELREVLTLAIRRRRHHACHIVWCGGNELTKSMERGTAASLQHPNLNMLAGLVCELDPGKHFLPCSPFGPEVFGDEKKYGQRVHYDVHGRWHYNEDHYAYYNGDDALFRSEVGTPGASSAETIRNIAYKLNPWPPNEKNLLWLHHGSWWIQWEQMNRLFGSWDEKLDQLAEYTSASQYLQAESLRYVVEAERRRWPAIGGIIIWMGNEPFANTANTSLLEYNGKVKPAYYWLKKAFSRIHLTCRYEKMSYAVGEEFCGSIFMHAGNDELKGCIVRGKLTDARGNIIAESTWVAGYISEISVQLGEMRWITTGIPGDIFLLRLDLIQNEKIHQQNTYLFTLNTVHPLQPLRYLDRAELQVADLRISENSINLRLTNTSTIAAIMVEAVSDKALVGSFSDGSMIILPGESEAISIEYDAKDGIISVRGYNVKPFDINIPPQL